jgi:hypothetical protein
MGPVRQRLSRNGSLELSEVETAEIAALDRGERIIDPADAPDWD